MPKGKKYKSQRKISIPATILALVAGVGLCFVFWFGPSFWLKAKEDAVIRIPENASVSNVTDSVEKYLGKSFADAVKRSMTVNGSDYSKRHGAYEITEGMAPFRAGRKLSKGAQKPVKITVNGFRTLDLLAKRISAKFDFTAEDFINAAEDSALLASYGLKQGQSLALFPDDTYEAYWSASPKDVVGVIAKQYSRIWEGERLRKAAELGLSPAEVVTISSIVDEESNKTDEKGIIGRLYINRLKRGMPLQADPTVRYAIGDFSIRRVLKKHLAYDSPYNTYINKGLPPGPIRTVGTATIDAVLDSRPSDYIFMCAKEDFSGHHNFATNLTDHNRNASKYQKALNERGIR